MRRRNREINIFSMSALDLFASAMGAFILIAVIALPYYLMTDKQLLEDAKQAQQQAQVAEQKAQAAENRVQAAERQISQLEREKQQLEKELDSAMIFVVHGIVSTSKKFVVLVDLSGSMTNYKSIMERTLTDIIQRMDDSFSLQIIGFQNDNDLINWQSPRSLLQMNSAGKASAMQFARSLSSKFNGGTPTFSALNEGLKYNTEAIILLTDGAPSDENPSDIVNRITAGNTRRIAIHTIALGEYNSSPDLVLFLQELARRNNGGFIGVSN